MKGKTQKGITLVALIITIVVLLILTVVAISSIQKDGIISYAQNAIKDYNQAQVNEQKLLNSYLSYMPGNGDSGEGSSDGTIGDATVGTKVTSLSTINGQEYSANNPVIPFGFMAINTTTSSWDATDLAAEVKKGLVISDGTSEFVWIPVAEINSFARLQDGSDTNYRGVLYDYTSDATGATEYTWSANITNYREPSNLTDSSYSDSVDKFTTIEWDEDYYQESFNKMVESVAEYKGFYVGRYEMSLSATGIAQSAAGVTSATDSSTSANMWWGLYEKARTYSTSGVISEMIWGCQYDAMLKWMQSNSIDVTSTTPTDTSRVTTASYNTTKVTGSTDSNDILNNIYDILGNSLEWTQEATTTLIRVTRGGHCYKGYAPSYRDNGRPNSTSDLMGSRLTLYIEM